MKALHSKLEFGVDRFADPAGRGPWLDLLRDIFGIDLEAASRLNVWADGYRAFCYMDGATIAANVSCRPLPLIIAGQTVQAGQIHAVATRPEYRRRGLFGDLMQRVLNYCDQQFDRLLLYTETPELYARFGFRPLVEYSFRGRLGVGAQPYKITARSLSLTVTEDLSLVCRLFAGRQPVSTALGLCRNEDIFVANALAHPAWQLSYLEAEDILVVWDRSDGRPRLIDIAGARMPSAACLTALLDTREIDVLFPPDRLDGVFWPMSHIPEDHDILLVRGPFPIEGTPFMLPLTAVS